ncbi:MAG TPA: bifunctional phosphoribosyl-AMP cyclohydrolase/phosphoribosyl-ATP diphosphatase HisIE [Gammaproteobacteria bacterium]|nr:bifunctional phosphoribosyl-AMP cyclohydrolase/phosphoribosyl-ATP diphosphatase HisIE [Gammaproteobacteria bacterium]
MKAPDADRLDWDKGDGLLPAIVQHALSGAVLMLGYMSRESFAATLARGEAVFFSRSRARLWRKGESSGNVLKVVEMRTDCDTDALLVRALPVGPTCHLGTRSCFGEPMSATLLEELEGVIAGRIADRPADSYVARLAAAGPARVAQKVGEEGVETALAAVAGDTEALAGEAADLLFHLLVLLQVRGLSLEPVLERLASRRR